MKILELGCGKRKRKGAIGIDISKDTDADVIHNLSKYYKSDIFIARSYIWRMKKITG